MRTNELIEKINNAYLLVGGDSEESREVKDEIVEKLRQLETLREMLNDAEVSLRELFSFSSKIIITDFQVGDIKYGRKEL